MIPQVVKSFFKQFTFSEKNQFFESKKDSDQDTDETVKRRHRKRRSKIAKNSRRRNRK